MTQERSAPQRRGAGCWVTAIVTLGLATLLVIVALFLPPFNLVDRLVGAQYVTLAQAGDAISNGDQSFRFAAATDVQGDFGVRVETTTLPAFESQSAEAGTSLAEVKSAVPYYLALQSHVYSIETTGSAPDAVLLSINQPGGASPELLDMYGWYQNETGSGGEWRFIPSSSTANRIESVTEHIPQHVALFQAAPDLPEVLVSYDVTQVLTSDVAGVATIVSPAGLQPTLAGSVTGSLAAGIDPNASYSVMPVLRDFSDPRAVDSQTVNALISNSDLRAEHIRQLTLTTTSNGFDGLFIDYRGVAPDQRENFTRFIRELSVSLRGVGRSVGVVLPAAENVNGVWETGAYDWRALGATVDYVQIRLGVLNPRLFRPDDNQLVEAMLRWAVGEVNRYKLLLGLSSQSVREIAGSYTSIGYDEALAGLGAVQIEADDMSDTGSIEPGTEIRARLDGRSAQGGLDESINTPYLDYVDEDGNPSARMWISTGSALRFRMDRTLPFALGGVAFDDLLAGDLASDVLSSISAFRTQIPSTPTTAQWLLRWRIVGADGDVLQEVTTGIDEELTVTLDAPDGNYAINPAVVLVEESSERESVRTGAQVALFRPTATPTPLPTATPTPVPTDTPTPAPIVSTAVPAGNPSGGGGGNANPLAAGTILTGSFEYGGHVTSAGSSRAIAAMRSAGMTWMKVQIRYSQGASPEVAAGAIQQAQANGFKILIGTVGYPNELAAGGDSYVQSFASWLGGIAALGADAIEVWNEPNLDREWPTGQLSGEAYTNMLRQAYQAIKSANSSTIVISGALAPTGAAGAAGCTSQICNDDRFLRDMVNAGALNYMDCVGIHYNEGIVPPTQTSGDPRGDNYYTRYFQTMVNTYTSITGGARQLCFTELGYLTPEGYPPLPAFFSWAQNVTVAQQAAWLAQAAALSSQNGNIRLMIVWNVDFTAYASDPQGGYAIIRPDGSCPACNALAGAR